MKKKKIFIIIILLICENYYVYQFFRIKFILIKIYIYKKFFHTNIIQVDISKINKNHGPGSLIKGINQVLPFIWKNCSFISSSYINKDFQPDLYFYPFPYFKEKQYKKYIKTKLINKFILGPVFVPKHWNAFPNNKLWIERNFLNLLDLSAGIAVHSTRVKDYLANKTNFKKNLKKYKIVRPCTNIKPLKIKNFQQRKIDIIFFEKYADLNRRKQGHELITLFKNTSKRIECVKYGSYNNSLIKDLANDSKFIIYFSFYDTGAIGLKEFQNYGVICFTHQKEFIIDNETSFYVPELDNTDKIDLAFTRIMNIIEHLSKLNIKSELIAEKNQIYNNCKNALIDLCKSLY